MQGTPKGPMFEKRQWTWPECSSSIRDRGLKEHLHLGSKRTLNKTFRQTIELEIAKRIVGSSSRMWRQSVGALWSGRPPPKQKKTLLMVYVPAL